MSIEKIRPNNDGKVTYEKVTDNRIGSGTSNSEVDGL